MDPESKSHGGFWHRLSFLFTERLSFFKTLVFNLNYFPLRQALRFPVIVHRNVSLLKMKGRVVVNLSEEDPGRVRLGRRRYGFQGRSHRTVWEVKGGTVEFGNDVVLGQGTFLSVGKRGHLKFGDRVSVGGNGKIICRCTVEIGADTMTAWDVQILDTDFHPTVNTVFHTFNEVEKPVRIGRMNWLCMGATILKGTRTPDGCIVGANTTLTRDHSKDGSNILLDYEEPVVAARHICFDQAVFDDNALVSRKADHRIPSSRTHPPSAADCG
ncbi:MAG: acyltransferase [Bacteroidales bacterium]